MFAITVGVFSNCSTIYAQNTASGSANFSEFIGEGVEIGQVYIGTSVIAPSTPLFALKTLKEQLEMALAQTDHVKQMRQLEFSVRRLREINTLTIQNRQDLIPNTIEHYLDNIHNFLESEVKDSEPEEKRMEIISRQMEILVNLYQKSTDPRGKMYIRRAIVDLEEYNRIQLPTINNQNLIQTQALVCQFLQTEVKGPELNQSQQVITAEFVDNCFATLNNLNPK